MKTMTSFFSTILLLGLPFYSFSQQVPSQCTSIEVTNSETAANAEDCILKISQFILSQHVVYSTPEYTDMAKDVSDWMKRTMNYTIVVNPLVKEAIEHKKNVNLLQVYHAALAHEALSGATNFHKQAVVTLIEYIRDEKNNVKITGKIKKMLKAFDADEFEKYYR
ncbi:MAG: hypothetical protein PF481_04800 [Bacteroidales bacterium]|jgi:hypothetical protein|nr:hypothetical protein [Bacteroidales bacterium]